MLGLFAKAGGIGRRISVGPKSFGFKPSTPIPRGLPAGGTTPALGGLFRSGRIVTGISQINAMATNVMRGSGH